MVRLLYTEYLLYFKSIHKFTFYMFKVADLLYMLKNAAHVSECMRTVAR